MRSATAKQGIVLLLASVMPIMAINSLVAVLPLLLKEFGATPGSEFLVPIALTIPALCVALFSPIAGWLSDRIGRKKLLVGALLAYAAAGFLPYFLADLKHIIAARFALGITEAAIMTVATTLIGDYFEGENREKWLAMQVGFGSIAAIFLVAAGGFLGEALGSRGPFLLYIVALPIAAAAAFALFEPAQERPEIGRAALAFPLGKILPLMFVTFGVGLLFYTVIVQLGQILQLAGPTSPAMIGLAGAGANIGMVLGSYLYRRLIERTGPALLALGLAISAAGYVGAVYPPAFAVLAGSAIVACIGCGMLLPNMLAWTMRLLPAEVRGRGTGLWTGAFFFAQFTAPLITTALAKQTDGLRDVLGLYAAIALAGALFAALNARKSNVA